MAQTHLLAIPNRDLLSSFAFNHYGTRLAASSLDHHVYVLSSDGPTGSWPEDDALASDDDADDDDADAKGPANGLGRKAAREGTGKSKGKVQAINAHDGPVVKVVWADPMHGELLASGGTDGTVRIWEEAMTATTTSWHLRSRLPVSRNSVRDLGFSPPEHGLKLAAVSADSHLRVYECLDVGTLANWHLSVDVDLAQLPPHPCARADQLADGGRGNAFSDGPPPASSLSSSSHPGQPPTTAAATAGQNRPLTSIKGFEIGSSSRQASTQLATTTAAAPSSTAAGSSSATGGGAIESEGGWALSWCPEHWWGELLVVASGPSSSVRLFRLPPSGDWQVLDVLEPEPAPTGPSAPVASLAWGPACGREFQLVAAGHRDGRSRVWRLEPPDLSSASPTTGAWSTSLEEELSPSPSSQSAPAQNRKAGAATATATTAGGAAKVEWNATGTVLATSGPEAKVRLWKRNFGGYWVEVAVVGCEEPADEDEDES